MTHTPRPFYLNWLLLLSGLLFLTGTARAHVDFGYNCASCHNTTSGVISLSGNDTTLSVNPRLDGGSTSSLKCFTAKPGDTIKVTLSSTPPGTSGDQYAFAMTGNKSTETLVSGAISGVKNSTSNKLSFSGLTGWTTQNVNSITYFTQGPNSWSSGAHTTTFQITIGSSTPADVYTLTYRSTGLDSTNLGQWTQSQEFLINVQSTAPVVTTGTASSISTQGATLNGTVNPNGVATNAYFQYGTTTSYGSVTGTQSAGSGSTASAFSSSISGLNSSTTYHYRLVAVSTSGTSTGSDQSFTTSAIPPTVTTGTTSAVTNTGAILTGSVNPNGTATSVFFNYGATASYGSRTTVQSAGAGSTDVAITGTLTGLSPISTYHYQLVAVTTSGTTLGSDQTFTTTSGPAVAVTGSATAITAQGATLNGTVNPDGASTSAYFDYGTTTSYGSSTTPLSAGSGITSGAFNSAISGLNPLTTYHYRLVAINTSGTSTGSDQSFTTSALPPTVATGPAQAVTYNGATLSGTINPNGSAVTAFFNYGTTASYGLVTGNQSAGAGNSNVVITAPISGLNPATTYHFQMVAVSASGTTLGTDQTFTTPNGPPVVVTGTASSITSQGSTLNGTVNASGLPTTAYFQYGLTASYGNNTDQSQSAGSGANAQAFNAAITGLNASTTYHYSLVAVNASGTTQGSDQTFTTLPPPPLATTGTATSVGSGGATVNGSVSTNGVSGTVYFNFGTTNNYGSTTSPQIVSGTNLPETSVLGSLSASTTYHFQIVVVTISGTAFGNDQTFTTLSGPPVATTGSATLVADVSATLNGTVNPNGGATNAFFQYGTTTGYGNTTPTQDVGSGSSVQSVNAAIAGLSPVTSYHFRAVAVSASGTSLGADQSFTTTASGNANLTSLALSNGQLSATFNPTINSYSTSVANSVAKISLTAIKADLGASTGLSINGAAFTTLASGKPSTALPLNVGANVIQVKVTAANLFTNTYSVTVYRVGLPVTGSASVDETTATLSGSVDGHAGTYSFQYGLTTVYASTTPAQPISSGSSNVIVSSTLSGLVPASLYHYRLVTTTGGITDVGPDQTFVTSRSYPNPEVASQGDIAPQIPGPVTFLAFGNPAINNGTDDPAHWAFQALVTGTGITKTNNSGIWLYTGSGASLIARTGDAAPGGGVFATLGDPLLNNKDQVAFLGTITGTGISKANNTGIWDTTSGTLQLVAQTMGQALDGSGVKASSFAQVVLPDEGGVIFLANLASGIGGVTASNNQGIWSEQNGQLKALIRKGDVVAGGTISALSIFVPQVGVAGQSRNFNTLGDISFKAILTNKSQADFVLTSGSLLSQIASSGTVAPSIFGGPTQYAVLGNPALNDNGNTAFQAVISGTAKGAPKFPAILAETGTANPLAIVALTGTYAPDAIGVTGSAGVFAALGDPVFNNQDQVAFIGKLKVTGSITGASSQGIWANTSGTLALVAQAQGQAPDCVAGTKFSLFTQLVLPDRGGVVFLATVAGKAGVTAGNNQGLFAVDTNGTLHLVARKGDVLLVNGHPKNVANLSIFNSTVGTAGQTRSFNRSGGLIYKVTFTDKTQALRKIIFP